MATKTEQRTEDQRIAEIVAALKAGRTSAPKTSLVERTADFVSGIGTGAARIAAGFSAGVDNAAVTYGAERERQYHRTAHLVLRLAQQ